MGVQGRGVLREEEREGDVFMGGDGGWSWVVVLIVIHHTIASCHVETRRQESGIRRCRLTKAELGDEVGTSLSHHSLPQPLLPPRPSASFWPFWYARPQPQDHAAAVAARRIAAEWVDHRLQRLASRQAPRGRLQSLGTCSVLATHQRVYRQCGSGYGERDGDPQHGCVFVWDVGEQGS